MMYGQADELFDEIVHRADFTQNQTGLKLSLANNMEKRLKWAIFQHPDVENKCFDLMHKNSEHVGLNCVLCDNGCHRNDGSYDRPLVLQLGRRLPISTRFKNSHPKHLNIGKLPSTVKSIFRHNGQKLCNIGCCHRSFAISGRQLQLEQS